MTVTPDERNLLLLLAKMILGKTRQADAEGRELRRQIARIEQSESYKRDVFVAEIMRRHPKT